MTATEALVRKIFKQDIDAELGTHALVWLSNTVDDESRSKHKISLHLVIASLHGSEPQLMYRSNHATDPLGASHLARRLVAEDPEGVGSLVDLSVYSKDREMRLCDSTKHGDGRRLKLEGAGNTFYDSVITYVPMKADGQQRTVRLIDVPVILPLQQRPGTSRRQQQEEQPLANSAATIAKYSELLIRVEELLQDALHPSGYLEGRASRSTAADALDPARGVKANFTDRREPCYTGILHEGTQNLRCWIDASKDVYCMCFSSKCADHAAHKLGSLLCESDAYLGDSLHLTLPFMKLPRGSFEMPDPDKAATITTNTITNYYQRHNSMGGASRSEASDAAADDDEASTHLSKILRRWLTGEFRVLSLRSGMGTGKSCFVVDLLERAFRKRTVLFVTYRVTLAFDLQRKLDKLAFVNYKTLDADQTPIPLHDRETYPRVICQIESLQKLSDHRRRVPEFDLVVVDEVESALRHFASPTTTGVRSLSLFTAILETAGRVMTIDAFWGAMTHDYLKTVGLSNRVVYNKHRTDKPRTYRLTKDKQAWKKQIIDDVKDGRNVVVVSMAMQLIHELKTEIIGLGLVSEDDILCHTSKSGDTTKKAMLLDVNSLWRMYRIVMYSPSVEAGVDFNAAHFHRMFVYMCPLSCLPRGLMQMTGRVRVLDVATIEVCAAPTVRITPPFPVRMTTEDGISYLTWVDTTLQRRQAHLVVALQLVKVLDEETQSSYRALMPPRDSYLVVMGHVEADKSNAAKRFVSEFADLVLDAGHRMAIDVATEVAEEEPIPTTDERSHMLLTTPPPSSIDLFNMRGRVVRMEASADDKWSLEVAAYCETFSIDRIDAEFLRRHGTMATSPSLDLLVMVIMPDTAVVDAASSTPHRKECLKSRVVKDLLSALGFASPFDTTHTVPDVMRALQEDCRLFADYAKMIRLFSERCTPNVPQDRRGMVKALDVVLDAIGLKLAHREKRSRSKNADNTHASWCLDEERVFAMMDLVKLRVERRGLHYVDRPAQYLAERENQYAHLVDRPEQAASAFLPDEEETI
jgi:hypothetical protein